MFNVGSPVMWFGKKSLEIPAPERALPGRSEPLIPAEPHHVFRRPLDGPIPPGMAVIDLALGCFWGAERKFWRIEGVWLTAVGYQGGHTPNPTYEETCTGMTGHTEAVRVVYDPAVVSLETLLRVFWESHDPTQGMRQGNDVGTQYRSAIFTHPNPDGADADLAVALASRDLYQRALTAAGRGAITTEIGRAPTFFFAETYHQQYLSKNPSGYCGLGGTGVPCPS